MQQVCVDRLRSAKNKVEDDGNLEQQDVIAVNTATKKERRLRRSTIPQRPNYSVNLWSIMKNCIGRDLSKIPMPVGHFCML